MDASPKQNTQDQPSHRQRSLRWKTVTDQEQGTSNSNSSREPKKIGLAELHKILQYVIDLTEDEDFEDIDQF